MLYWALSAMLLLPVWVGARFPTEDGPAHVYYTDVYRDLADPSSRFHAYYERSVNWNTPNLSYFWLQYVLAGRVESRTAQRVAVSIILLSSAAVIYLLSLTIAGGITLGALAALLLLHNWFLYSGYFSFLISVPLLLLTTALLAGPLAEETLARRPPAVPLTALTVLGVATFYSHLVGAGIFLGLIGLRVVTGRLPLRLRMLVALAGVPTLCLIVSYMMGPSTGEGGMRWLTPTQSASSLAGMWFWHGFAVPGLEYRLRRTLFMVLIALIALITLRALRDGRIAPPMRFVLLVAVSLFVLRLVSPDFIGQGGIMVGRIDLVAWSVLLPGLGYPTPDRWRTPLTALAALLLAWQVTEAALRIQRFNHRYRVVLAQAARVPAGSIIRLYPRYGDTTGRFENSYVKVLTETIHDVAQECGCVVVDAHHPNVPYYWVKQRPRADSVVDFDMTVTESPTGLSLVRAKHALTPPVH